MATLLEVAAVDLDLLKMNCLSLETLLCCGPVHQGLIKLFQRVNLELSHRLLPKLADQVFLLLLVQFD